MNLSSPKMTRNRNPNDRMKKQQRDAQHVPAMETLSVERKKGTQEKEDIFHSFPYLESSVTRKLTNLADWMIDLADWTIRKTKESNLVTRNREQNFKRIIT